MIDTEVKFPDIKVRLTGTDGNAFAIMGNVGEAMRRAGISRDVIAEYTNESMSAGSYDELLLTACRWVRVS